MLQLFASGKRPRIDVVATDEAFWVRFKRDCPSSDSFADTPHESGERVDLRLAHAIQAIVRPVLGEWEQGNQSWWHNIDWNGDGVRGLSFNLQSFKPSFVAAFHQLLVGEHVDFCVLVHFYRGAVDRSEKLGALAIYHDHILVVRSVAQAFAIEHA